MAYALIEITQVGPPEHPLVRVLHEAICPGEPWALVQEVLASSDALLLLAHLESNPLAYLVAQVAGDALQVRWFGVLPDYRREKVASRLLARAQGHAQMRRLSRIEFTATTPAGQGLAQLLGYTPSADQSGLWIRKLG